MALIRIPAKLLGQGWWNNWVAYMKVKGQLVMKHRLHLDWPKDYNFQSPCASISYPLRILATYIQASLQRRSLLVKQLVNSFFITPKHPVIFILGCLKNTKKFYLSSWETFIIIQTDNSTFFRSHWYILRENMLYSNTN